MWPRAHRLRSIPSAAVAHANALTLAASAAQSFCGECGNAMGGVSKIIANAASDNFEGYVTLDIGNDNKHRVEGAIDGPPGDGYAARPSVRPDGYSDDVDPRPSAEPPNARNSYGRYPVPDWSNTKMRPTACSGRNLRDSIAISPNSSRASERRLCSGSAQVQLGVSDRGQGRT